MIIVLIREAQAAGARLKSCCDVVEIDLRTIQRWLKKGSDGGQDRREGSKTSPANKLSTSEREDALKLLKSPEFSDLPPQQLVPTLASLGMYIGSESTLYRILREEKLNKHRSRSRPQKNKRPKQLVATGPNQVWSWDICVPQKAIREMRDRPLAIGLQEQVANHRMRLRSKALVVSVTEKVPPRYQVRTKEGEQP